MYIIPIKRSTYETKIMLKYNVHRTENDAHYNSMTKNNLQEIMNRRNLSYGELAKITGISKSTLYRISNFLQSPTQDMMISIAKGLKMDVIDVFNFHY